MADNFGAWHGEYLTFPSQFKFKYFQNTIQFSLFAKLNFNIDVV